MAQGTEARRRRRERALVLVAAIVVAAGALGGWWLSGAGGAAARRALGARYAAWQVSRHADQLGPAGTGAAGVPVEVAPGERLGDLAARLEGLGLVRDAEAFVALARREGLDRRIQAGRHVLRADMSAAETLRALEVAAGDEVTIALAEGLRAEEIADRLAGAGLATRDALRAAMGLTAADSSAAADLAARAAEPPIVAARPAGRSLEGYLFPDTYRFAPDAAADAIVARLLEAFDARVGAALAAGAPGLGLSPDEVVTLASIVEREAVLPVERAQIARVFLNRLAEPPYLLNADPTIQYALGFQPEPSPGTWWKRPLSAEDLTLDSPYNGYRVGGLPPSPIANPGAAAIEAVLAPADGPWMYFVADAVACDGSHVFAATYEAHLANVARVGGGGACQPGD